MLNLYNTRTQRSEPFLPAPETTSRNRGLAALRPSAATGEAAAQGERPITIYVCGITPYDTTHLGHAFTYIVNDTLIRYLEYNKYPVRYVQNVTDIDDDILRKAAEVGESWQTLVNRWTTHFVEDLCTLNARPPDYFPRATSVIPQIIEQVQALIEAGVAYVAEGSVYYAVDRWPKFGELSRIPRAEMLPIANERGNQPDDPNKRDPLDFVLWQAQQPGEPAWESPWGKGRPGWHIECSTMATALLGETIDLHSGGSDLLFPHHECEIAQVEPATHHAPFARFWLHVAMVRHEGEKMSKSLGNLVMVRDLLQETTPDALRIYLAQHHYRKPWAYDPQQLQAAAETANHFMAAVTATGGTGRWLDGDATTYAFAEAMDDDLDTPTAIALLHDLANRITSAAASQWNVEEAQHKLRTMASVFGLRLDAEQPQARVIDGWNKHLLEFA
ncbi:MAG: cysteine--tRNA ligase [Caldilineaceae bacterium]|nr:cysteine--tRNA ligase [Caldilineaceae bacterium]